MKSHILFSLVFVAFMLSFSGVLKAQKNDSPIFSEKITDIEAQDKVLPILSNTSFVLLDKSMMKRIPATFAKRYSLPTDARMATKAMVLKAFVDKTNTHCIRFSCVSNCESCYLVWSDRNGDGKIQPIAELRCMNKAGRQSGLKATRVDCK